MAVGLTANDDDDGAQVGALLDHVTPPVVSFIGDGAFDRDDVYYEVAERHPDTAVILPPRSSGALSETAEAAPTQRDRLRDPCWGGQPHGIACQNWCCQ